MPAKNHDLHGNVPDSGSIALLFIDVINDLEFEGSEALAAQTMAIANNLVTLRRRAKAAGIPNARLCHQQRHTAERPRTDVHAGGDWAGA